MDFTIQQLREISADKTGSFGPSHASALAAAFLSFRLEDATKRDELVQFVESVTWEFETWTEAEQEQIEGQLEEVAADHNWMLDALKHLHRFARMPSAAPKRVRGGLPNGADS